MPSDQVQNQVHLGQSGCTSQRQSGSDLCRFLGMRSLGVRTGDGPPRRARFQVRVLLEIGHPNERYRWVEEAKLGS